MDTLPAPLCTQCEVQFVPSRTHQTYCSDRCQRVAAKARARSRVRANTPKKRCAHCGDDKPSRKGNYCSKPDCVKRSARISIARYGSRHPDRVKANWQRKDKNRAEQLLAERGPKPNCASCKVELRWWGAAYCSSVECQREKKREENRNYYVSNQDAHRSRVSQYRARKVGTTVEPINVATIYERDHWRCGLCSKKIDQTLTYPHPMSRSIDHIIPLSCGGTHTQGNLQAAHLRCNVAKGNRGGGEQLALL